MAYRGLTPEQFEVVKEAAKKVCTAKGLKTIGDWKCIGNEIINRLENKTLTYADLLKAEIPFEE